MVQSDTTSSFGKALPDFAKGKQSVLEVKNLWQINPYSEPRTDKLCALYKLCRFALIRWPHILVFSYSKHIHMILLPEPY